MANSKSKPFLRQNLFQPERECKRVAVTLRAHEKNLCRVVSPVMTSAAFLFPASHAFLNSSSMYSRAGLS